MQYIPLPTKWISETPARKVTYLTEKKPCVKKDETTFIHFIKMFWGKEHQA